MGKREQARPRKRPEDEPICSNELLAAIRKRIEEDKKSGKKQTPLKIPEPE